jgi:hypothetical protein
MGSKLEAGAALRGWQQDLDHEGASAASGSASLRYHPNGALALTAALLDLGTPLAGDPLRGDLRLGLALEANGGQRLAIESTSPLGDTRGADYGAAVEAPLGSAFTARAGVQLLAGSLNPLPTAGFSVSLAHYSLDFAYRAAGDLGSTLHAGISFLTR